jgi:hypothetical protein
VHGQVDRVAIEDLTIGGELIRAGEFLLMNLPAGNWDGEFVDTPEELDIDRNTRGHLGFGYGVHQCIGQNLARVEMQIALATLARRLPGIRWRCRSRICDSRTSRKSSVSRSCPSPGERRRSSRRTPSSGAQIRCGCGSMAVTTWSRILPVRRRLPGLR